MADGNPKSRSYAFDVVIAGDGERGTGNGEMGGPRAVAAKNADGAKRVPPRYFKSVYFSGVNAGIGHEPNGGVTTVEIPVAELPPGRRLTIAVRPVSSLGTKGKAIGTVFRV